MGASGEEPFYVIPMPLDRWFNVMMKKINVRAYVVFLCLDIALADARMPLLTLFFVATRKKQFFPFECLSAGVLVEKLPSRADKPRIGDSRAQVNEG